LGFRINYNGAANGAQFQLNGVNTRVTQSVNKLSSGLRLSQPKDNPHEFISAEGLRHQIETLREASSNVQNATSMTKLADSNLGEVNKLLNRARAIAVSSGNTGAVSTAQLQSYQSELAEIWSSINRIAGDAQWGSQKLLDGSSGAAAAITNSAVISQIGFKGTSYNVPLVSAPVTVQQTVTATQTTVTGDVGYAALNTIVNPGSFTLNGISFSVDGATETVQNVLDKVNALSSTTGVRVSHVGGFFEFQSVEFGSKFPIQLTDPNAVFSSVVSPPPTVLGTDAQATVSITTENGVQTLPFAGGQIAGSSGLLLSDSEGNTIRLSVTGNGVATAPTAVANITVGNLTRLQLGNEVSDVIGLSLPDIRTANLGSGTLGTMTLDTIDVTTSGGAGLAIQMIDAAIDRIGEVRSDIGSFQKYTLESRDRSLSVTAENFAASESDLRDLDVALEMTEFTKQQLLQQASASMLAQANQMPQQVLRMLEG
jgi:flagellin